MNNTALIRVGRLLEIACPRGLRSTTDVDELEAQINEAVKALRVGVRAIIFADWRTCTTFSPDTAERVGLMFTRDNAFVERSAILHQETSAMGVLQLSRLIREARNPERRVFSSFPEASTFLREKLTAEESARLTELIAP